MRSALFGLLLLLPAFLAADEPRDACAGQEVVPAMSGEFAPTGVAVMALSKTISPGDDFFVHINEGWINSTLIPPGYWDYGQTSVLAARVDEQINLLLGESLTRRARKGSAWQQVGDAYASFLDTATMDRVGRAMLSADVASIIASNSPESIASWMAHPTSSSIIAINVYPAERRWRVHLDQQNHNQPMLGLAGPDAYLNTDAGSASVRESYRAYVGATLARAGIDDAARRAERVLALESRIAGNLWSLEKLRDRRANYHPMSVRELESYAPGFPWNTFLKQRGVGAVTDIVLGTDTAVQLQSRLFAQTPIEDWASYLAFHWIQNQVDVLPSEFQRASWEFHGKSQSGASEPPPRQQIAARLVSSALGHQVGRLYANRFVSARTRASAEEIISYLRKAFAERLSRATWMDDATRTEAQAKLARFEFKVGFPKKWRNFSGIRIRRDDAAGNLRRLRDADWAYQKRRLDPRSRDELWYQTPQTVDASYSVLLNAIELPGAFLQPPYFDAHADPAANFGAIGAIVGHEMGHAFDDQGIVYDSNGRMRNWWSDDSLEQFHRRARVLADQYDGYAPYPDAHVNGQRTIGENMADLSGVLLAYRAYRLYVADHRCKGSSGDGLTGDQRFFAAWAQAWRYKAPESAVRHVIKYGYHAPTPYRVNGVVRNIDEWYAAFNVGPGDKLYLPPEKRVRIW